MMTGGSRGHAILVRRLAAALESARQQPMDHPDVRFRGGCRALDRSLSRRRGDVAGGRFKDLTATAPVLIAEVISPSSAKDDLGAKAEEYLRLPSLSAYLVLAQDASTARVGARRRGFSPEPKSSTGTMPSSKSVRSASTCCLRKSTLVSSTNSPGRRTFVPFTGHRAHLGRASEPTITSPSPRRRARPRRAAQAGGGTVPAV